MALTYLSLPRTLGQHPDSGKDVTANAGRFGPYVAHDGNFRSIKAPLDVYTITFNQALELLAQEKKPRGFQKKKKE
jgi:DNA topoisomerase-1